MSLAFLEPTISIWMQDNMEVEEWQVGMIWLPAFIPHVLGVYSTVKLADKYPKYQWAIAAIGLSLEGICSFMVPFSTNFWGLFLPISGICFGIAQVDTALLPLLGYLVDTRYVSVYGSIYAIADISYSLAYAFGPIIAGGIVETIGFTWLNVIIAVSNLAYVPVLTMLRHSYDMADYGKFSENVPQQVVMATDPPTKEYQTYAVQDGVQGAQAGYDASTAVVPGAMTGELNPWGDEGRQTNANNPFTSGQGQGGHAPNQRGADQYEMKGTYSANYSNAPVYQEPYNQANYNPQQQTTVRKQIRRRDVTSSEDES